MNASSSTPSLKSELPDSDKRASQVNFPQRVWNMLACFRSIQLAITLLSLLALATLAGVLIPQEGLVEIQEIKKTFGSNYRLMSSMGLFNVYSSYWFIALEVMFFFNLLFGSFKWLKPAFLAATKIFFLQPVHIQAAPSPLILQSNQSVDETVLSVKALLKKKRYGVHLSAGQPSETETLKPVLMYASKDSWSRLGPVVAHFGILMMLVASVYGVFFGFKAQKLAVPGETFKLEDSGFFKTNVNPAVWLGKVPEWKIRVNDFKIDYYLDEEKNNRHIEQADGTIEQYYADLSVLDTRGKEIKRETISVNHPLTVGSTVLYQASFKPTGKLFLSVDGKQSVLEVNTTFMNRPVSFTELENDRALLVFPFFAQQDPGVTHNHVVVFLRDKTGFVGAKKGKMPPNLRLQEGASGNLHGIRFQYVKPEMATGLQIKHGPEVPWMYTSYLIIILGTAMCIFSQRQIWLAVVPGENGINSQLMLMYKTKKARVSFLKEVRDMQTKLLDSGQFLAVAKS